MGINYFDNLLRQLVPIMDSFKDEGIRQLAGKATSSETINLFAIRCEEAMVAIGLAKTIIENPSNPVNITIEQALAMAKVKIKLDGG